MTCKCGSKRIMNIGGGDYIDFSLCLNCGQIQGEWPLEIFQEESYEEEI